MRLQTGLAAALTLLASVAGAGDWTWAGSGNLELQTRIFADAAAWDGQASRDGQYSLAATGELRWRKATGRQRVTLVPYLRWDSTDTERSLADLREAYWAWDNREAEVLVGVNKLFWGVTESVHLVDIVNQTDLAADLDGESKLGQPMLSVAVQRDWGRLGAYLLPWFRERSYPGIEGRLRPPLPVDSDASVYQSGAGQGHVDVALRYSHYIGDVDIGLSVFSGTSREPWFEVSDDGRYLVPHYDQIDQAGLDLQYTTGAWLWKLEAIARSSRTDDFAAAVGGFEYTYYQVRGSAADIGVLFEVQYDGRGALEPPTAADHDAFAGIRLASNDERDTSLLAGISRDTRTGETFVNIEAERRLGDDWTLELRARAFAGAEPGDTTYWLASDDYVEFELARYF